MVPVTNAHPNAVLPLCRTLGFLAEAASEGLADLAHVRDVHPLKRQSAPASEEETEVIPTTEVEREGDGKTQRIDTATPQTG